MGKFVSYLLAVVTFLSFTVTAHAQEESQENASAAALYNEGLAKYKAQDFAGALDLMVQAVEAADPESETDAKVIGLAKKNGAIFAYKAGTEFRKEENFEEAIKAFDTGMEFSPGFYANFIGRAQALEGAGKEVDAVSAYLKAGEVSAKSNKPDKAEQMDKKAENMVALTFADKDWEKTAAMAESFLSMKETPDVHFYMSHALKNQGDTAKAIEHAQKAVEMAEEDKGKYLMALAESYEAAGQTSEAVEAYKQVPSGKYSERAEYKVNELTGGR